MLAPSGSRAGEKVAPQSVRFLHVDASHLYEHVANDVDAAQDMLQPDGLVVFDASAVLIAMVTLSQLPIGPSVGAAAVVVILGANGPALAAAAGVLLTATGTAGALVYAGWAGADRLWTLRPAARRRLSPLPRPATAGTT